MRPLVEDLKSVLGQLHGWLWALLLLLPVFYLISGFYSVGIDQRAFVSRMGKVTKDNITSGMHYHLPWPIEQASIHNIPSLKSKVIIFELTQTKKEALELITGDGNLIDSQVEIQYSVTETVKYISSSVDTELSLGELAKSEIIYHISHNNFESLLTTGRNQFQEKIKLRLQNSSDKLDLGLRITGVQIKLLEPPTSIKKAFDDVSSAQSEKQKVMQEARGERGTQLAKARSESNRERSNAKASSNELVKRAEGDVERFDSQLSALISSDKIFIQRRYMENLEAILSKAQIRIIAPDKSPQKD